MPWPSTPSLTIVYKTSKCFHFVSPPVLFGFLFVCFFSLTSFSRAFVSILVVGRYFWSTKAWNGDGRQQKKKKTDRLTNPPPAPACGTPLRRAIDNHIHASHGPLWIIFRQPVVHQLNTKASVFRTQKFEHLAILIQMLASHHLSQQHITSTLLTFTHVYFRCVICLLFFVLDKKYIIAFFSF